MTLSSFLRSHLVMVSFALLCLPMASLPAIAQSSVGNPHITLVPVPSNPPPHARSKVPVELKLKAQTDIVRVIVQLNVPIKLEALLPNEEARLAQRQAIKEAQDKLVKQLTGTHSVETGRLTTIPVISFITSLEGLAVFERSPLVVAVTEDIVGRFNTARGCPVSCGAIARTLTFVPFVVKPAFREQKAFSGV